MGQKTYWHLLGERRMPTEYELLTSKLLYYPGRGFEVNTPLAAWYGRYQSGSPLAVSDWERFADPRATTYSSYTRLQRDREVFVDGILELIDDTRHDEGLSDRWLALLEQVVAPLRYPMHGLQMVAAYLGQMAPSGRITVAALFQTADEMRRVQRLAYRLAQLRLLHPALGDGARASWENDPLWQPLRRTVEELLVTWDFGEVFTALNLCLKPIADELFLLHLGATARAEGDYLFDEILHSLRDDCLWHRAWSATLVQMAVADRSENRAVIERWIEKWQPKVMRAAAPFVRILASAGMPSADEAAGGGLLERLDAFHRSYLAGAGLGAPTARVEEIR